MIKTPEPATKPATVNPDDIMLRRPTNWTVINAEERARAAAAAKAKEDAAKAAAEARAKEAAEKAAAEARAKEAAEKAAAEARANEAAEKAAAEARAKEAAEKAAAEARAKEAAEKAAAEARAKEAAEKAAAEARAKEAAEKAAAEARAKEAAEKAAAEAKAKADAEIQSLRDQLAREKAAREDVEGKAAKDRAAAEKAAARAVADREAAEKAATQAAADRAAAQKAAEAKAAAEKRISYLQNPDPDERPKPKKLEAPADQRDVTETVSSVKGKSKKGRSARTGRDAVITSERTDYDRKEGVILFDRNVYVDDEQYKMHADRLFVFLDGTNDLKRIVAIGNVSITNEDRTASCSRAVFTRTTSKIVMYGDEASYAKLQDPSQRGGMVEGKKITFWLDAEQVTVEESAVRLPGAALKGRDPKKLLEQAK